MAALVGGLGVLLIEVDIPQLLGGYNCYNPYEKYARVNRKNLYNPYENY